MTRPSIFILLLAVLTGIVARAQYAPQVPLAGNEGIADTSSRFRDWASGCTLYRGWLDIADKSLGQPTLGTESNIYGPPGSGLLSLGDSGVAVVTFGHSIYNGAGADFAVFENAFANPENDTFAFLELAFVEVSSDGQNFFRFPASSAMQDTVQIDNFNYSDAHFYHNLAGKYLSRYGTPFDLDELKDKPGLDVDHITHIRIVDVIGSIDPLYASRDQEGNRINDPYPSVFPSGGFDLRGIGVINSNRPPDPTSVNTVINPLQIRIYPNPASDVVQIVARDEAPLLYRLTDISGRQLEQGTIRKSLGIPIGRQAPGLYLLYIGNGREQSVLKVSRQ